MFFLYFFPYLRTQPTAVQIDTDGIPSFAVAGVHALDEILGGQLGFDAVHAHATLKLDGEG
jgi:hypothetical protein